LQEEPVRTVLVVSPQSQLHVLQSDRKSTLNFCTEYKQRHNYFRKMAVHETQENASLWVLLSRARWIRNEKYGAVVAVAGPKALFDHQETICLTSGLPVASMRFGDQSNVGHLLNSVPREHLCTRHLANVFTATVAL